ncbi:NUDIX hydrolase N-terminal domain-containing protein [Aeromonas media]|uniref:NUDIX hydrolase n=1 Tax=Aeromonas media TaxID=651 RepID=UPI001CF179F4|nr:NUDIX hydrolase [Aeromonas media]UCP15279.1 NUDIX hydrolase N-terminal domain-containing protein [Aeromonas media]
MQPPLATFLEQVLATAQAGLTYSNDPFDIARFEALRAATAALIVSQSELAPEAIAQWIALDSGYPTPKLDVRALIQDDAGRLLLVQECSDGLWTLPGGWCDIGDSPAGAVVREVSEETGLECRAVQLLALFDKLKHPHPPQLPHAHKAFFLCEVTGGSLLTETDETQGAAYFPIDALPELSRHRVVESQLRSLHDHVRQGRRHTLFD